MHDEMLMTKPDRLFGRAEVESMCRSCHGPHRKAAAVERFRKKWLGRARPNGRTIAQDSVCTDCHGTHNIVRKNSQGSTDRAGDQWTELFDRENLDNWDVSGDSVWTVRQSSIFAIPGRTNRPGRLLSRLVYRDYLLAVTFRAEPPIRAWLLVGAEAGGDGLQVVLLDSDHQATPPGSLLDETGRAVMRSLRPELFAAEGWNTISVAVQGGRIRIWLNGEQVGSVNAGRAAGKVGLYVAPGSAGANGHLQVREVVIKPSAPHGENIQ